MDIIVESLKKAVEALDKLPMPHKTPQTTNLRRLTVELIAEMEKEQPETKVIEGLTEQINELQK
jgi:hypothetical protein